MRNFVSLVICAFAIFFLVGNAQYVLAADPPKSALLVAIGDYPAETGWPQISSLNDVALIKNALIKQGFAESEIHVLTDEAATKVGIVQAIRQYLVETAKPGGVAYFHFSGHGQQVADDNNDELDGYDEALVPINSPLNFQEGVYEGENLLRDDELGQLLDEVRRKLGPTGNMLAVLDACHSGTGTRGIGKARGTLTKMASPAYVTGNSKTGKDPSALEVSEKDERSLAPMVAFFGAAQHQLNFETKDENKNGVGSLSYAFSKKFALAAQSTTYRGLFEQIKLEMSAIAPSQNPQVEGSLDQEIMAGRIVGAPEFYRVASWNDPSSIIVEAGWLHGLQRGAILGFYPPETRSIAGATPLTKGTVIDGDPTSSTVELDAELDQEVAMSAWVFVLEQSFGDLGVSFTNSLPPGHPVLPFLRSRLEKMPVVKEEPDAELNLTLSDDASRGAAVQLITSGGIVIETFKENQRPELLADNILKQMKAFGQARYLKNLELESYYLPVSFEIIPIKYDPKTKAYLGDIPATAKMDENGNLHFDIDDGFRIKVTNDGHKTAYFTLIDIQPNNVVTVLMPMEGTKETPSEFVVSAGSSYEVPKRFVIGPPSGMEVFKLIATDQPIDLRSISKNRGQSRSVPKNPFEKVFTDSFFNEDTMTRGGKALSMSATDVNVASKTFVIE
ncbi:MAG: caspase family protein [Saprospiraceae bacterium]|nr:caspase family protein [Saprospiraceae bacterium]MCF8251529.1 caspase family protein [Saprospiraceae bacterium]MCF8280859.1 caspase family protein [Bacteroidales bacterium]MCF8310961.1 caspase family protein [Saprospiraceae bacterium]MCF8439703.1 caspase family protein [Saprospiraceae bacterium]